MRRSKDTCTPQSGVACRRGLKFIAPKKPATHHHCWAPAPPSNLVRPLPSQIAGGAACLSGCTTHGIMPNTHAQTLVQHKIQRSRRFKLDTRMIELSRGSYCLSGCTSLTSQCPSSSFTRLALSSQTSSGGLDTRLPWESICSDCRAHRECGRMRGGLSQRVWNPETK